MENAGQEGDKIELTVQQNKNYSPCVLVKGIAHKDRFSQFAHEPGR